MSYKYKFYLIKTWENNEKIETCNLSRCLNGLYIGRLLQANI